MESDSEFVGDLLDEDLYINALMSAGPWPLGNSTFLGGMLTEENILRVLNIDRLVPIPL